MKTLTRVPELLVRIAMADAYGMGVEYLKLDREADARAREEVLKFERYVQHPHYGPPAGFYTDDTEMSVANTHVLLTTPSPYTKLDFAQAYVDEFAYGGARKGYSQAFQVILERVRTGEELLQVLVPNSNKNGAAMRSVPFGVLPTVDDVLDAATVSATVTHDTDVGRFGARAVALASHFSLYESDSPLHKLRAYLEEFLPDEDNQYIESVLRNPWDGTPVVGSPQMPVGLTTVRAVLTLVTQGASLMQMLETACRWGGDVDSVAAIAWGIAAARHQTEILPEFFEASLEQGSSKTGPTRLHSLGTQLMDKYSRAS